MVFFTVVLTELRSCGGCNGMSYGRIRARKPAVDNSPEDTMTSEPDAMLRPEVLVLDVNETLSDLGPMREIRAARSRRRP